MNTGKFKTWFFRIIVNAESKCSINIGCWNVRINNNDKSILYIICRISLLYKTLINNIEMIGIFIVDFYTMCNYWVIDH